MKLIRLFLIAVALLIPHAVFAQTVNPTQVLFDYPASDFAGVDGFVVGYFSSATTTTPVQEGTIPKASVTCTTPTGTTCTDLTSPLPSRPSGFQTWYTGVRATAGTVTSPWSAPLVPFVRAPQAPTNVRPK